MILRNNWLWWESGKNGLAKQYNPSGRIQPTFIYAKKSRDTYHFGALGLHRQKPVEKLGPAVLLCVQELRFSSRVNSLIQSTSKQNHPPNKKKQKIHRITQLKGIAFPPLFPNGKEKRKKGRQRSSRY